MATKNDQIQSILKKIEAFFDEYLGKKAPQLPKGAQTFLVTAAPWIVLFFLILSVPAILVALGIGAMFSPFVALTGILTGFAGIVHVIFGIIIIILQIMAIPGLFNRQKKAWYLMYYVYLISIVQSIFTINPVYALLFTAVGLYFLFQIKSHYK